MRLPIWLYLRRDSDYDTIWRFGSRRPLRAVYTVIRGKGEFAMPTTHLLAIGRLNLSYGSADGITEGLSSMATRWWHLFERRNGMGLLIAWERG